MAGSNNPYVGVVPPPTGQVDSPSTAGGPIFDRVPPTTGQVGSPAGRQPGCVWNPPPTGQASSGPGRGNSDGK